MYKSLTLFLIVSPLFINVVTCLSFNLLGRQDAGSPAPPSPSASSNSSSNATAVIISSLSQDGIPSACDTECIPPFNATMSCTEVTCRCTDDYEKSLFDCYLCAGNALQAKFDTVQGVIDTLWKDCFQLGFNLTELTFPGEDPNRALTSSFSSVPFTLALPTTPAATNTQGVGSHPQITQGTTSGSAHLQNGTSEDSEPAAVAKNGDNRSVTSGIITSFALTMLGALSLLSSTSY